MGTNNSGTGVTRKIFFVKDTYHGTSILLRRPRLAAYWPAEQRNVAKDSLIQNEYLVFCVWKQKKSSPI
jgi:hypothetical protein